MKLNQQIPGTEKYNLKPAIVLLSIGAILLGGYLIYGFATLKQAPVPEVTCEGNYINSDGTYCDNGHWGTVEPIITTDENDNTVKTYVGPTK